MVYCRLRRGRRPMAELRMPVQGPQIHGASTLEAVGLREAAAPLSWRTRMKRIAPLLAAALLAACSDTAPSPDVATDNRPAVVGGWQR